MGTIVANRDVGDSWFVAADADVVVAYRVKSHLFDSKTPIHSRVQVMDLGFYGKTLALDGVIQNSLLDDRMYNEIMVHPAMLMHPCPKNVFIAGGAGGATAREVLLHKSVESVIQVEIDEACAVAIREHFYGPTNLAWAEDERYQFRFGDALEFLKSYPEDAPRFDVIVMDISDPLKGGPCYEMFSVEFYERCKGLLAPDGVILTQSSDASFKDDRQVFLPVVKTFQAAFGEEGTLPCIRYIPVFQANWGFVVGLKNPALANRVGEGIDELIAERLEGGAGALESYDEETHRRCFSLDKYTRKAIAEEERIISLAKPVFFQYSC